MSIFDPAPFFNSPFVEMATIYEDSNSDGVSINVIVNRADQKESTFRNSNISSVSYPLTVDIKKEDWPVSWLTITKNVSKIKVKNIKYIEETLFIKDIVYADEHIWRVAL